MPRSLTGSHVPGWVLTKVVPRGLFPVTGTVMMTVPSGKKIPGARPDGVEAIQAPTIGWVARAAGVVSWARARSRRLPNPTAAIAPALPSAARRLQPDGDTRRPW